MFHKTSNKFFTKYFYKKICNWFQDNQPNGRARRRSVADFFFRGASWNGGVDNGAYGDDRNPRPSITVTDVNENHHDVTNNEDILHSENDNCGREEVLHTGNGNCVDIKEENYLEINEVGDL